jgi:hypothetical protein
MSTGSGPSDNPLAGFCQAFVRAARGSRLRDAHHVELSAGVGERLGRPARIFSRWADAANGGGVSPGDDHALGPPRWGWFAHAVTAVVPL